MGTLIGLIVIGLMVIVGGSLLGWVLKLLGFVFGFLWDGCSTILGSLFWLIVIIIALMAI